MFVRRKNTQRDNLLSSVNTKFESLTCYLLELNTDAFRAVSVIPPFPHITCCPHHLRVFLSLGSTRYTIRFSIPISHICQTIARCVACNIVQFYHWNHFKFNTTLDNSFKVSILAVSFPNNAYGIASC